MPEGKTVTLLDRFLPKVGDKLSGRYELIREIDRGGFGVVMAARQIGLDEVVSIKILLPHVLAKEELVRRFELEVKVAKGLRHPNSIRILDVGRTDAGLPFYVMEYVEGRTLKSLLKEVGILSEKRTRRIALQVASSLSEAHTKGIVHRDLKPGNLMLCQIIGEKDHVKVLDFGIAKAIDASQEVDEIETHTGVVLGTPAYMSPEQARGSRDLDGRSDVYSLGLIIAECLDGIRVVSGNTMFDAVSVHASKRPLAFGDEIRTSPFWPILRRATAKTIEKRCTATELAQLLEDLEGLSDETPDSATLEDFELVEEDKLEGTGEFLKTPDPQKAEELSEMGRQSPFRPDSGQEGAVTLAESPRGRVNAAPEIEPQLDSEEARLAAVSSTHRRVVLAFALIAIAVTVIVVGQGDSADSSGSGELRDVATNGTLGSDQLGTATVGSGEDADGSGLSAEPAVPPADPAEVWAAIAEGRRHVALAAPMTQTVRFFGTDGARVSTTASEISDALLLGELPFERNCAMLDTEVLVTVSRRGYQTATVPISLLSDTQELVLERRRRNQQEDSRRSRSDRERGRDRESDESGSSLPFGEMRIYDGAREPDPESER